MSSEKKSKKKIFFLFFFLILGANAETSLAIFCVTLTHDLDPKVKVNSQIMYFL